MKYIWLFIKTVLRLVLKPLSFVPAIIVMYCIFNFSSQSGVSSAQLSYKVTHKLVETVDTIADLELTDAFMEMGVDELSVSPGRVLPIRKVIVESSCS